MSSEYFELAKNLSQAMNQDQPATAQPTELAKEVAALLFTKQFHPRIPLSATRWNATLMIQQAIDSVARPIIDFAEWGWTIIANVGGGDWEKESPEWREAAARYRDDFHNKIRHMLPTAALASAQEGAGDLPSVGGRRLDHTIAEFERRAERLLKDEQEKIAPDNVMVAFLCDAVRLGREYCDSISTTPAPVQKVKKAGEWTPHYEKGELGLISIMCGAECVAASIPTSEGTSAIVNHNTEVASLRFEVERLTESGQLCAREYQGLQTKLRRERSESFEQVAQLQRELEEARKAMRVVRYRLGQSIPWSKQTYQGTGTSDPVTWQVTNFTHEQIEGSLAECRKLLDAALAPPSPQKAQEKEGKA